MNRAQKILLGLLEGKSAHYRKNVFERIGCFGQTVFCEDGTRHHFDVCSGKVSLITLGPKGSLMEADKQVHIFSESELKFVADTLEGRPQQAVLF